MLEKLYRLFLNSFQTTLGLNGGSNITISNTSATTGKWCALQVIADAEISAMTIDGGNGAGLTGIELVAGTIIYGYITSITLTSGTVRMYGGNNINIQP